MTTGTIEAARPSKSGKTLGVKVGGKWYSTSEWDLQNHIGETITITDVNEAPLPDGGSITYLNAYTLGAGHDPSENWMPGEIKAARAARENNQGRPDANDDYTKNVLLLRFIGQCLQSFQWQTSDLVVAQTRARQCYELGESILDGSIATPVTTRATPQTPRPESEPLPEREDYDDDIPF